MNFEQVFDQDQFSSLHAEQNTEMASQKGMVHTIDSTFKQTLFYKQYNHITYIIYIIVYIYNCIYIIVYIYI